MRMTAVALAGVGCAFVFLQCTGDDPNPVTPNDGDGTSSSSSGGPGSSSSSSGSPTDAQADAPTPLAPLTTTTMLAMGQRSTCFLRVAGDVVCWGAAGAAGLPDAGAGAFTTTPHVVPGLGKIARLVAGVGHYCALGVDHTVKCWGDNTYGQIAQPLAKDAPPILVPTAVGGLTDVMEIASGALHVCATRPDHSVWCWGLNDSQQLGHSQLDDSKCGPALPQQRCSNRPIAIAGLRADELALGGGFSCVRDGDVTRCWGSNNHAELGHAPGDAADAPPEERASSWANVKPTAAIAGGATRLFAGASIACILTTRQASGHACWGNDDSGASGRIVGQPPFYSAAGHDVQLLPPNPAVIGLSVLNSYAIVAGELYGWGLGKRLPPFPASGSAQVSATKIMLLPSFGKPTELGVSGDGGHNCVHTDADKVVCWGQNDYRQAAPVNGEQIQPTEVALP